MQQHKYENAGAIFCQQLYAIHDSKSPEKICYHTVKFSAQIKYQIFILFHY